MRRAISGLALLALLAYRDRPEAGRLWLVLSALALFAAYLTKLPNAFFVPGFYAAAWLWRRSNADFALYAGLLTLAVGLEIAAYAVATAYPLGRISMVVATHAPTAALDSPLGLLGRFAALPGPWLALVGAWLLATALLLARAARSQLDDRALGNRDRFRFHGAADASGIGDFDLARGINVALDAAGYDDVSGGDGAAPQAFSGQGYGAA